MTSGVYSAWGEMKLICAGTGALAPSMQNVQFIANVERREFRLGHERTCLHIRRRKRDHKSPAQSPEAHRILQHLLQVLPKAPISSRKAAELRPKIEKSLEEAAG